MASSKDNNASTESREEGDGEVRIRINFSSGKIFTGYNTHVKD